MAYCAASAKEKSYKLAKEKKPMMKVIALVDKADGWSDEDFRKEQAKHAEIARSLGVIDKYSYSFPNPNPDGSPPAHDLIVEFYCKEPEKWQAKMETPEGKKAFEHAQSFTKSIVLLTAEEIDVW
ncbi:MAG TPA: EthD domain-containing protein [Myxococcales bacterium LLY-WYZ-16_1]|nr:EthD domain-containing protein [Myxococcales bacterium LLY-WYZ-16_1]